MGNTNDLVDQYKNMNIDETKEKVFVLLGLTGVGKSSFINGITNTQKCEIGHTLIIMLTSQIYFLIF